LKIVEVEERLRLQVVDLALGGLVGPRQLIAAGEQVIAVGHRLLELAELFDQQLGSVQVRGDELRIGHAREFELVEGFFNLALVPQNFAATVVRFGTTGMSLQGFFQPGQRLVGTTTVGGFHRLIQAIPVSILVFHSPTSAGGAGEIAPVRADAA